MSTTPGITSITLGNRLGALGQELGRAKRYPTGVVIRSMSVPLAYQRIENVVFDNPELYLSKSRPVHVLDSLIAESPCTGLALSVKHLDGSNEKMQQSGLYGSFCGPKLPNYIYSDLLSYARDHDGDTMVFPKAHIPGYVLTDRCGAMGVVNSFVRASLTPVVKFWEYDLPGMTGINGDRRIYIPVLKG